ncbi:E3 ubiquitin-protein ligase TRIM71-like [Dysidea avara]|uniref:E3 ubiquitin-protein ligase TRIM71-like n=1 Tax=Dysidea avara TaxID=196820 RepID=UPI00332D861B
MMSKELKETTNLNKKHANILPNNSKDHARYLTMGWPSETKTNKGEMGRVYSITFDKDGTWATTDYSNNCVYKYNDDNSLSQRFGAKGKGNGQFENPSGIAFGSDGSLYVAEIKNNRVQKFDIKGKYLLQFGSRGCGQLRQPTGIAVHEDRVYVADTGNSRIAVFQNNGTFCGTIGTSYLSQPHDVAISDHLFVADVGHRCVYKFTIDGHYVDKFGDPGMNWGQLCQPRSLAIDAEGYIFVADTYNQRVSIFDGDGECVHIFGSCGSKVSQFCCPQGVAISPKGGLYVCDHRNQRIQIFPTTCS